MDTENIKIGFIGFGGMAGGICDGLLLNHVIEPSRIYACARDQAKLRSRCDSRGINASASAEEVASACDIIVIGVLPQQVEGVVRPIAESLRGKLIFSIASGISYSDYLGYLGEGFNHITAIPNIPIAAGEGIIIAESSHSLTHDQQAVFEYVFGQIARIEYVGSDLLLLGASGAGCTPAFVDVFIEALADALVKHGMSRSQAYGIVPQMMIGTAKHMMLSGKHPGELKDAVCSPGGTTIVGISTLEECGFRHAVIQAIDNIMAKCNSR